MAVRQGTLTKNVYDIYFPVINRVEIQMQKKERVIIAIDGPCASGKSSLAALLSELYPSRILHMDDYYLPMDRRTPGWEQIPSANMDLERFMQEALKPAARGQAITYQPYSCREGKLLAATVLPPARLTIVEGSYSHHPLLAPYYDLKFFLSCTPQEQLLRLQHRESSHLEAYLQRWIPLEQAYYQTYDIPKRSDFCFDNTRYFT